MAESNTGTVNLLVKTSGPIIADQVPLGLSKSVRLQVEPLFRSIGHSPGMAVGGHEPTWHLVKTQLPSLGMSQWQLCHELLESGGKFAAGGVTFAEPDLEQTWDIDKSRRTAIGLGLREGRPHDQDPDYPVVKDNNFWFRALNFGEFDEALAQLPDPGPGKRVRIAHLDTGYDPSHATTPAFLSAREQKNFVDEDRPDDATDRSTGILSNFSHGTGTLSILASKAFGCAPNAEVIPIRVANRVVLFRNSAIARAMDHVHELCRSETSFVHVLTMSMGGLPSESWVDAINALYEAGVFIVTAAGNNYGNLPSRYIVYPARFERVVAACGSMANGKPYADLSLFVMAGDYGPPEKMSGAISAYTPNVPWARFGKPDVVDFDGNGTSAATPQVAGSAALWIQRHRNQYERLEGWERAEAVRSAIFQTAQQTNDRDHFGVGRLKAVAALASPPSNQLQMHAPDKVVDGLLEILLGAQGIATANAMHKLELKQILQATGLEAELAGAQSPRAKTEILGRVLACPSISDSLRGVLSLSVSGPSAPTGQKPSLPAMAANERLNVRLAISPEIPPPSSRKLKVFAYDPSPQTDPALFGINEATVSLAWEPDLSPGPIGEYLEVVDVDPASHYCYAPVDLNHLYILAANGHSPSEANPQFHQQMVYAVAMRTIARFERALGRKALWAPRILRDLNGNLLDKKFVQRLRIYPHAMRERNAYYSSQKMALLFGYFAADATFAGNALPGSCVFCSVSHDIIAHETTHALLDGLHPRFQEATNPDVLAFHEAFADIIALFLHFTMPESLLQQIKRTKGDMYYKENLLGQLAVQFGQASGLHGALRSAIGTVKNNVWKPASPTRRDYADAREAGDPHELGSCLVSAVFAAFVTIYRARSADLIRLATNGTGILPEGEISHDLAIRLAKEAAAVADQVLNICIRALDYVPPIDITFGEYLRALVTADRDLVPEDPRGYRVAFIAAFRDRGIFPGGVRHLAEDSLVWLQPAINEDTAQKCADLVKELDLRWSLNSGRYEAYEASEKNRIKVRDRLLKPKNHALLDAMGFEPSTPSITIGGIQGELRPIEVRSVRPTRRTAPDESSHGWVIMDITQTFRAAPDGERYRGGCTLIVDLNTNRAKYIIRKRLRGSVAGVAAQREARMKAAQLAAERGMSYVSPGDTRANRETFALLHRS